MNKVAIVTGASRGIGKEIAKMLANEGIQVIEKIFYYKKMSRGQLPFCSFNIL